MRKSKELITSCLDLYFNGMSLRKIRSHVRQFTPQGVSHMSVWRWLIKYSKLIKSFTDNLEPQLSRVYHADEIFIKCKGEQNYYWDIVDARTRFLVATHYSTKRSSKEARKFFMKVKQPPIKLFTDKLPAYMKAYRKTWGKKKKSQDRECYTRLKADKDKRNNIIERVQGTIRERVKVMRGLKREYSAIAILDLLIVWYNYIRIHQGINTTPAQKSLIELKLGQNKWLSLINLSSSF